MKQTCHGCSVLVRAGVAGKGVDDPAMNYPSSDESFVRLHQAGWSVGEVAVHTPAGIVWLVSGTNGENAIEARGETQAEA